MKINTTIEVTHTDEGSLVSALFQVINSIVTREIEDLELMDGTYKVGDADLTIEVEDPDDDDDDDCETHYDDYINEHNTKPHVTLQHAH